MGSQCVPARVSSSTRGASRILTQTAMPPTSAASLTRKRTRPAGSRSPARAVRRSTDASSRPGASALELAGPQDPRRVHRERGEARGGHERRRDAERLRGLDRGGHERHRFGHERAALFQEPLARAREDRDQGLLEAFVAHELADHHVELAPQPHPARVRAHDKDALRDPRLARQRLDHRHQHRLALDRHHAPRPEPRRQHRPDAAARAEVEHVSARPHACFERSREGAVAARVRQHQLLVGEAALQA